MSKEKDIDILDKTDPMHWPITLLSRACTGKLIEDSTDRDAGNPNPGGHRYDAYFQTGSQVIRIASIGRPVQRKPGDHAVLSVYDTSIPDRGRGNMPSIRMESVAVPWFDFQAPLKIHSQTGLKQYDPNTLSSLADAINGGTRIDRDRFDILTTNPIAIPA